MGKTWDSTWTSTKEYYKEYINPEPVVDLAGVDYSSNEEKLADLFAPVDRPMGALATYLNSTDVFPGEKWQDELFKRFPWLNGCEVSTLAGEVVMRRPETTLKPLNLAPFQEIGQEMADRKLRCHLDMTPMGPEVYLATAMFKGNDMVGFISVHFDPRSLIKAAGEPADLMVLTPEAVIWPGQVADRDILGEPWNELLADEVQGYLDRGGKTYFWMTRYLGEKQFVYLTEAVPEREDDSFLWFF